MSKGAEKSCAVCQSSDGLESCELCQVVGYCKEHQTELEKTHKAQCIKENESDISKAMEALDVSLSTSWLSSGLVVEL